MTTKAVLLACAVALCACSTIHDSDDPASTFWSVDRSGADPPPASSEPFQPGPGFRLPVAMAATDQGLLAFDPGSGAVLAFASTSFPVVDIVHDPWRDRWLAAEYADDSESRVSVWKLGHRGLESARLELERTIEAGGYSRLAPAPSSTVVFEHDGMHQRWLVWSAHGPGAASSVQAPMPLGVVERTEPTGSRLLSVAITDDGSGPRATMYSMQVQGSDHGPMVATPLLEWSGAFSPVRVADAGPGRLAFAQVQGGKLKVGMASDDGHTFRDTIQVELHRAHAVEDLVVDERAGIAVIAVSGPDRLIAFDLDHGTVLDQRGCAPLTGGAAQWFSRSIAYDPVRGRLLVAGNDRLEAWDLARRRRLDRVEGFGVVGARRTVSLSASRSGPMP